MISGLGSDSSSWSGITKGFSPFFQTIVFDNRGSGRSDITHKECTVRKMAEDTIRLLDFLKIERAHIIGHSTGGYIAQELAINYPERVDKLVLVSTAPVSSKRNDTLFADFYDQLKIEGCYETWIRRWVFWLFSPGLSSNSSFIDNFIKNSVKYPYIQKADGSKSQIDAIASFDARDRIGVIKARTLILEGKDDILITPEESKTLTKEIHKSIFELLDGAAHSMHIENPKLFISTVLKFLNAGL